MKTIIRRGKELLDKGEAFVLAKVVQTSGSAPRHYGAWLLMERDGSVMGTIGGGKLEAEVIKAARETFAHQESRIHDFQLTSQDHGGIDMRCGGNASIEISYVEPAHPEVLEPEEAAGESGTVYVFGAGHIAKALVPVLHSLEFLTVVIDDRSDYANPERFPGSELIVSSDWKRIFSSLAADENSYCVIVTRGHNHDLEVLREAIQQQDVAYIGMIGSRSKIADIFRVLESEGVERTTLDQINTPIGLPIGAETPEEIAISIAAELIQTRAVLRGSR